MEITQKITPIQFLFLIVLIFLPQLSFGAYLTDFGTPISHWTCDELSGVRHDSNTTNSNDLTDNNTVLYGTGLLDYACDFESANTEYLSITDADQLNLEPSTYTISYWYKPESTSNQTFFSKGSNATKGHIFQLEAGVLYYNSWNDNAGSLDNNFSKTFTFTAGTWYHIVIVRDVSGNSCDMYINGSDQSINCVGTVHNINNNADPFRIGYSTQSNTYLDGLIDEFTIWGTALNSTQITSVYNGGTPLLYEGVSTSSPSSSTTVASSSVNTGGIEFMLSIIIFFLSFMWYGSIMSSFKK